MDKCMKCEGTMEKVMEFSIFAKVKNQPIRLIRLMRVCYPCFKFLVNQRRKEHMKNNIRLRAIEYAKKEQKCQQ